MQDGSKGYVIQLYQFAIRYAYNNRQFLSYFNNNINQRSTSGQSADFLVLGDFDLLEINPVSSFRQYHDVSIFAKKWLGKRQCMLLYDISEEDSEAYGRRLYYVNMPGDAGPEEEGWHSNYYQGVDCSKRKFFCLSMFALTNRLSSTCSDMGGLIRNLRRSILGIVDYVNENAKTNIQCEVFGTFNTSELAIVWLGDEYEDILQMIEYIKHLSVQGSDGQTREDGMLERDVTNAFMTTFSIVSAQMKLDLEKDYNFRGDALVQVSFNDECADMAAIKVLKREIQKICIEEGTKGSINYDTSVGEFDWLVRCPASTILKLLNPKSKFKMLLPGEREKGGSGRFIIEQECRKILRNNTRLLIGTEGNQLLKETLENVSPDYYVCRIGDLLTQSSIDSQDLGDMLEENRSLYFKQGGIRDRLKAILKPSAGIVDTMDLLITDYQSVISTAYSKIWAEDIHVQFRAVLQSIELLLNYDIGTRPIEEFWELYSALTNAFKQQVYHLTQSSRLFFEIPTSHLRATGHYDFLMHAYYGIAKKIIEVVYIMQYQDAQSELVPLLTVNTEPQVKSELFYQLEKDTVRAMNLIIPNSVLTEPYRGLFYLVHELFHYCVPQNRTDRNYRFGAFLMGHLVWGQVLAVLRQISLDKCPEAIEAETRGLVEFLNISDGQNEIIHGINEKVLQFVATEDEYGQFEKLIEDKSSSFFCEKDALRENYENAILMFLDDSESNQMFSDICSYAFTLLQENTEAYIQKLAIDRKNSPDLDDEQKKAETPEEKAASWIRSRLVYYLCLPKDEFNKRVCLYRFISDADLEGYYQDQLILYKGVMEAYSDLAAITLTGFSLIDYIVFYIQNVYDVDRKKTPEGLSLSIEQQLRLFLVLMYCNTRGIGTDSLVYRPSEPDRKPFFNDVRKNLFKERYISVFLEHRDVPVEPNGHKSKIERLQQEADVWVAKIESILQSACANFAFFNDGVFFPILDNANVLLRRDTLLADEDPDVSVLGKNLQDIIRQFHGIYTEYRNLREKYDIRNPESYKEYMEELFDENIKTIQFFQNQKSLYALNEKNNNIVNMYKKKHLKKERGLILASEEEKEKDGISTEFTAYNWEELQFYLKRCNDNLIQELKAEFGDNKPYNQIWYRGETSTGYYLEPTLLRNLKDKENHDNTCKNTRERYEFFKTQCDGSPDMAFYGDYTQADYLALMQHYGIETNLLDFTDNAFIALYLALKYFSDEEKIDCLKQAKEKQRSVVLWMFSPALYNLYRRRILENYLDERIQGDGTDSDIKTRGRELFGLENTNLNGVIPNLSIPRNEKLYARYIFGESWMDERYKNGLDDQVPPLAVWTPRLNHRIRAQSGSFVAFDVYADPHNYKTLGAVQTDFMKKDRSVKPFLYRIIINENGCQEICEALKHMGLTRRFVYPELDQVKYHFKFPKE